MDIIIREGTIVTGSEIFKADIGIKSGKINCIASYLPDSAKEEINATGKYIFPGFIDAHTHLNLPISDTEFTADDFYSGTLAAAFGGTTSIVDYIVPSQNNSFKEAFTIWNTRAESQSIIDYGFHMTISNPSESNIKALGDLKGLGITSIKCFTAYKDTFMMNDEKLFEVLLSSTENDLLVCAHCENGDVLEHNIQQLIKENKLSPKYHEISRGDLLEAEAVSRLIYLSEIAQTPIYIAHVSSGKAVKQIKAARDSALTVYGETCPQYLMLNKTNYLSDDLEATKYICSPPLREDSDIESLWKGIACDDIQVVATDHCSFNVNTQKIKGLNNFTKIPNGMPGIEDRVHILYSEGVVKRNLDINKFVAILSQTPAKLFGLYPTKGSIIVNADADIVIFNPNTSWNISCKTHHQNVDYNPYEGLRLQGKTETVISRGEIIIQDDTFKGIKGRGKYLHRSPSSALR